MDDVHRASAVGGFPDHVPRLSSPGTAGRCTHGDNIEGELLWAWGARQYLAEIYNIAVDRAHAHRMLVRWYQFIADHLIGELISLATTVSAWETEILNYFDHRVTNGRTEGRNRTIKHVKRTGYGYRNTTNYTLKCRYQAHRIPSWTTPAERTHAA